MQQIRLHLHEDSFSFHAGQYLEILHPCGAAVPMSIASSPLRLPELHLHYQSTPGSDDARLFDELLASGGPLRLRGPGGDVFVTAETQEDLLLIAGGTGASQALAIIDDLRLRQSRNAVTLLCCADRMEDFYFRDTLEAEPNAWLSVTYMADARRTAENSAMQWLRSHAAEHRRRRILLCGGPPFVYAASDALLAGGVDAGNTESDVFSYAPRH